VALYQVKKAAVPKELHMNKDPSDTCEPLRSSGMFQSLIICCNNAYILVQGMTEDQRIILHYWNTPWGLPPVYKDILGV